MTNFEEYAFGLNPTSGASANPLTDISKLKTLGQFTYTRRANSGLTYTVMTSTNLVTWHPVGATETLQQTVNGVQTILINLNDDPTDETFFIRVQAN